MNELLEKIYENVIRQEDDTLDMEKRINDCMEEYISHYDDISEKDKERIRDIVYYAVLISEKESVRSGLKVNEILCIVYIILRKGSSNLTFIFCDDFYRCDVVSLAY